MMDSVGATEGVWHPGMGWMKEGTLFHRFQKNHPKTSKVVKKLTYLRDKHTFKFRYLFSSIYLALSLRMANFLIALSKSSVPGTPGRPKLGVAKLHREIKFNAKI